jgi:hypothetical protein
VGIRKVSPDTPLAHGSSAVMIQGYSTPRGRKILLVNKTNRDKNVSLSSEFQSAASVTVEEATGDEEPRAGKTGASELKMAPFAVTILTIQCSC